MSDDLENPVRKVIDFFGSKSKVAQITGVSHVAVSKWESKGKFPRTDYTGETSYARKLAQASEGHFNAQDLLPQVKVTS